MNDICNQLKEPKILNLNTLAKWGVLLQVEIQGGRRWNILCSRNASGRHVQLYLKRGQEKGMGGGLISEKCYLLH